MFNSVTIKSGFRMVQTCPVEWWLENQTKMFLYGLKCPVFEWSSLSCDQTICKTGQKSVRKVECYIWVVWNTNGCCIQINTAFRSRLYPLNKWHLDTRFEKKSHLEKTGIRDSPFVSPSSISLKHLITLVPGGM